MEKKKSSNNWVKRLLLRFSVFASVIAIISLVISLFFNPFITLESKVATVKRIELGNTPVMGGRHKTDYWEVYKVYIEEDVINYFKSFEIKEMDFFGINNIVGRKVYFEYNHLNTIYKLVVDGKIVFDYKPEWKLFFIFLTVFFIMGTWGVWGIIDDYKKRYGLY